jgi:hypothetical protein
MCVVLYSPPPPRKTDLHDTMCMIIRRRGRGGGGLRLPPKKKARSIKVGALYTRILPSPPIIPSYFVHCLLRWCEKVRKRTFLPVATDAPPSDKIKNYHF